MRLTTMNLYCSRYLTLRLFVLRLHQCYLLMLEAFEATKEKIEIDISMNTWRHKHNLDWELDQKSEGLKLSQFSSQLLQSHGPRVHTMTKLHSSINPQGRGVQALDCVIFIGLLFSLV